MKHISYYIDERYKGTAVYPKTPYRAFMSHLEGVYDGVRDRIIVLKRVVLSKLRTIKII